MSENPKGPIHNLIGSPLKNLNIYISAATKTVKYRIHAGCFLTRRTIKTVRHIPTTIRSSINAELTLLELLLPSAKYAITKEAQMTTPHTPSPLSIQMMETIAQRIRQDNVEKAFMRATPDQRTEFIQTYLADELNRSQQLP